MVLFSEVFVLVCVSVAVINHDQKHLEEERADLAYRL